MNITECSTEHSKFFHEVGPYYGHELCALVTYDVLRYSKVTEYMIKDELHGFEHGGYPKQRDKMK